MIGGHLRPIRRIGEGRLGGCSGLTWLPVRVARHCEARQSCRPRSWSSGSASTTGGDGVRSSGGWSFASDSGEVFTVYEWRSTTLSNGRGSGSPTVRQFWTSWEPVRFHIGGVPGSDWRAFRRWLQAEFRAFRKEQAKHAEQRATANRPRE